MWDRLYIGAVTALTSMLPAEVSRYRDWKGSDSGGRNIESLIGVCFTQLSMVTRIRLHQILRRAITRVAVPVLCVPQ
jgi:hypothetical protein